MIGSKAVPVPTIVVELFVTFTVPPVTASGEVTCPLRSNPYQRRESTTRRYVLFKNFWAIWTGKSGAHSSNSPVNCRNVDWVVTGIVVLATCWTTGTHSPHRNRTGRMARGGQQTRHLRPPVFLANPCLCAGP